MNTITPFTEENNKYILETIKMGKENVPAIVANLKSRYPDTAIKILRSYVGEVFRLDCVDKRTKILAGEKAT